MDGRLQNKTLRFGEEPERGGLVGGGGGFGGFPMEGFDEIVDQGDEGGEEGETLLVG